MADIVWYLKNTLTHKFIWIRMFEWIYNLF